MCPEGNASSSSSPPRPAAASSPSGKRARDPEDEVYVDNLHSHKRYLSEIMASSLNGLKVGDPLSTNLVDSPARDDFSLQYSPMSEDSDDSRYCESSTNTCSSHPESIPTSPVSPYRCQKPGFASGPPPTSHGCVFSSVQTTQSRHRGSDNEGRFPSSPSDICHSADLRRAALLRSVQMRAHPLELAQFESPYSPGQESVNSMEPEEQPCSCTKAGLDENEHQIAKCAPLKSIANHENGVKSSCRILTMNLKDEGSPG
ncbi:hypothetical protein F511_11070 [Dorcoceras hygrometricum]|uniref:Uncharacterized protein n=1 Tax=Dorcoceras hygrometricum TaxID=472368 RepID=A0A2Z7AQF4_9LAMI|nr:hypothetical protein F511_11070 [Dorcoceras hygrometricum]